MNMAFSARIALPTIAEDGKVSTDKGRGVHASVGIAALRVGAFATLKMDTSWRSFGRGVVGQITRFSGRACTFSEVLFAQGNGGGIMGVSAARPFQAMTWKHRIQSVLSARVIPG